MSGSGGGGGYEYQAMATAYVAAHILAQERLGWIEHEGADVPISVAEETGGAGDDLCITLSSGIKIELQAKHGLEKNKLWEPLIKLGKGLIADPQMYGVILTDSSASKNIREDLRNDLKRLGQGCTDDLKAITKEAQIKLVEAGLPESDQDFFRRLVIIVLDLDKGLQDGKQAQLLLSQVLHDNSQSAIVWNCLCQEGVNLITHRGCRDLKSWARLLSSQGIKLAINYAKVIGKYFPSRLPDNLRLTRHEEIKQIKELILTETDSCVSIWGMAGSGKSTLALDIAKDIEIETTFPDEIFWLTLGRQPLLTDKQLQLARELGYKSSSFTNEADGKACLLNLLSNRKCLLILDDVWETNHVNIFRDVLSENSKILFTSQNASVITSLGLKERELKELNGQQSQSLLAKWAGEEYCSDNLPNEAHEVIKKCGNLPLALSLCGAMIRDGMTWVDLLKALQDVKLNLIESEQFSAYYHETNLLKALKVSVDALSLKEPLLQQRYLELAIFSSDEEIPEEIIFILWKQTGSIDELEAKSLIRKLERKALLRCNSGKVSLHDLQYAYLRIVSPKLKSLHNKLLECYQQNYPMGWHTAKNDGYFFEHLAYHLIEAGKKEELYCLLTKSQDWMNAKFQNCMGDASYLSDIKLAIESMNEPLSSEEILFLFQLHTAHRVVYQRSDRYSSGHYAPALIWLGRKDEVLSYARLYSDTSKKFATLANTYRTIFEKGQIDVDLLEEVWQAAREIEDIQHRASALALVASELYKLQKDESKIAFDEALSFAEKIDNKQNKTRILLNLAKVLCEMNLREESLVIFKKAKEIAQTMDDNEQNTTYDLYSAKIEDLQWKVILLCNVVDSLWQENFELEAKQILEEAKKLSCDSEEVIDKLNQYLIDKEYLKDIDFGDLSIVLQNPSQHNEDELKLAQIQIAEKFEFSSIANFIQNNKHNAQPMKLQLLQSLVFTNNFDDIENIINKIDDNWFRNAALMTFVSGLVRIGEFNKAKKVAQSSTSIVEKINLLCIVAEGIAKANQQNTGLNEFFVEIENIIDTEIFNTPEKDRALYLLSTHLSRANNIYLERAEIIALQIIDFNQQSSALAEIVKAFTAIKNFSRAEATIEKIKNSQQKSDSLSQFAIDLVKNNRTTQAQSTFKKAQNITIVNNDFFGVSIALRLVAIFLAKQGYSEKAKFVFGKVYQLLENITDSGTLNIEKFYLSLSLIRAKFFNEAEELNGNVEINNQYDQRSELLCQLALGLVDSDLLEKAQEIIEQIDNKQLKLQVKCQIYKSLNSKGLTKEAKQIYTELEMTIRSQELPYVVKEIAVTEAELQNYNKARDIAQTILDHTVKMECLCEISKILAKNHEFEQAKSIVWDIEIDYIRANSLCDIALQADLIQHRDAEELFSLAKHEAQSVIFDWAKSKSLCELASAMYLTGRHTESDMIFIQAKNIVQETIYRYTHPEKRQIRDSRQAEVVQWYSNAKTKTGSYKEAFAIFSLPEFSKIVTQQGIEQLIINVINWSDTFEQIEPRFSAKVLIESIRIAGWIHPTWKEIYSVLL